MIKAQKYPVSLELRFVRFLFVLIFLPFIKKIRGKENLPREGTFILAANHTSHIDSYMIGSRFSRILGRHIHFLATTKYFKNPLFNYLANLTQGIWTDWREPAKALLVALKYLKEGEAIGIFPEGTRSPDGKIKKGKTGVAALALQARVPVVPVGLIDTDKILPRGKIFFRPARCEVNIGAPLDFKASYPDYNRAVEQKDQAKILEIEEKVVRVIMKEIARLSNQEYPY